MSSAGCINQGELQRGSATSAHSVQRDSPVLEEQGYLEMLLSPSSIEKLSGEVENDAPFPHDHLDLSGTWDLGMQPHPCFLPQGVGKMLPIPETMLGIDLPTNGILLPLRDISKAEMPPNVRVTLKRKRCKQQASSGHLTRIMGTMNSPGKASLRASAEGSRDAEPGPAPEPCMHSAARLQRQASDTMATGPPTQPPPKRHRSVRWGNRPPRQQHEKFLQQQPRTGPKARPAEPTAAASALAAPTPTLMRRRRLEGAPEELPAVKEEPQEPQRKLRRRGDIPQRLAAILENERSPCSEDTGEKGDWSASDQGASPSAVTGCNLSKAACRAQGALHQLTKEEVMEAESELTPGATEEEREAAYKRVRNRSAARKTRRKKVETTRKLQEQVQVLGKQNRDLISRLNNLLFQLKRYSQENAQLQKVLRDMHLQPVTAKTMPPLASVQGLQ